MHSEYYEWSVEFEDASIFALTLNSDEINSSSRIAKYRTRDSDVVFLDFGDDAQDTDPYLL